MYNRRPKYKTYDKIYFIVDKHLTNDYIETLEEAFKDHSDFIKDIKEFEMSNKQNPNQKTTFINIRLNSKDLTEGIFTSLAKKINKIINKDFKVFFKSAYDVKYTYTPDALQQKPMEELEASINKLLMD
jgi:hypothetical protein